MKKKRTAAAFLAAALIFSGCQATAGKEEKKDPVTAVSPSGEETDSASGETPDLNHLSGKTEIQYQDSIPYIKGEIFAMDTYMSISCYGEECEEALDDAFEEIIRLDDLLSVGNPDSEITILNREGSAKISEDTGSMIETALSLYEKTDGYFDITVYPMMELWGFTDKNFAVPGEEEIRNLLQYVDSKELVYDKGEKTLSLGKARGIDLGAIAKGFTSDRLMEIFREHNLVCGLVSLGGNVEVFGTKTDGSKWRCGVKNPNEPDNMSSFLGVVSIADCAVITSGAYERYFTDPASGKTYHHIIDPHTGYSSESGMLSATIVSRSGTIADGLSTSIYAMGLEKATAFWKQYGEELGFDMILMTEDQKVWVTEPLKKDFSSDFRIHYIS